tara:strand:- start:204 stop:446 length:243 start_codon:yes stop_codon:yes gene_type:complete
MAISIIRKRSSGRPYSCCYCDQDITSGTYCIKDLQTTGFQGRYYYHPTCFSQSRPEKTYEIWDFWNKLKTDINFDNGVNQ